MKKYCMAVVAIVLFASQSAWSHASYLHCAQSDAVIHCKGGFSDGSSAFGVKIKVLNYDEEVLFEGRLNQEDEISFPVPQAEAFYIKFDGGAGHEVEVDYTDIADTQLSASE